LTATEAPISKPLGHEQLADGKLETCNWIYEGNAVVLEFEKKIKVFSIEMIYPTSYKGTRLPLIDHVRTKVQARGPRMKPSTTL
jgi:hypothetical protein